MRYAIIIISITFYLFAFIYCNAQSADKYIFHYINQSDGLLHNSIFSITQDAKGYIWILSPNGFQRYDGSRFVNYPYEINNNAGISYTNGAGLFADKKNNTLWIIHENIEKLDLLTNKFITYNADEIAKDPLFKFESYTDTSGNKLLAGKFGLLMFDSNLHKMVVHYFSGSSFAPNAASGLVVNKNTNELLLTDWHAGLLLFDKKEKRMFTHDYNPLNHPLLKAMYKKGLYAVFIDSDKNTWMLSDRSNFYKYNPSNNKLITYSLTSISGSSKIEGADVTSIVNCMFEDNHNTIWLGTQNAGLLRYNKKEDSFTKITGEKDNLKGVEYNFDINCIFQDKNDNIWLGTDKGITVFNPYRQYFQSVYHDENNPLSIPKNEIQECIEARNGDILACTWGGGITVYDSKWNFKKNIHFFKEPEEYNLLWCFVENDDGTIWAGCQHGYIHIYDPVKETVRTIHPPELSDYTIRCMAKDKKGNILLGLHDGEIAKWDKAQNKFYSYNKSIPGIPQIFTPVINMHVDENNYCWAGTANGLKKFDPAKMIFTAVYVPDKKNPEAISSGTIQSIDQTNDSTLAIGTIQSGLDFFNINKNVFTHITNHNGLPSNTINNITTDAQKNIWFTTDYGLYKYNQSNTKFTRYNIEQGIMNSSFKAGNIYALRNGNWIITTLTDIISFNPDSLGKQEANNLQVDITGFKISDKDFYIDSFLQLNKPVKLSYQQNFISIEYSVLNFSGVKETKYYYQMNGIDKDWVDAGTNRFASYTDLAPGEYLFRVKTANESNNPVITSFQIIITPPFWKTIWFKFLIGLIAITTLYLLVRRRIKVIKYEAELKQKIAETEMMALRAQMNPHFIFNCINSIDALIQSNDKYHATVYLNKFAKLIRNILDSSKQTTVTLEKDLDTLQLYIDLEQLRHENKFTAIIQVADELMHDDYKVPPLIIQPFVENAILHGIRYRKDNNGKLSVNIVKQNDCLKYIIEDNGVGRSAFADQKQKEKISYGIDMSNNRVKLFNQEEKSSVLITDLFDHDEPAGTKVEVLLKIQEC